MAERNVLVHKDDVLQIVCAQMLDMMDSEVPVSCTHIAQRLGISVYAARKCMHELEREGFVKRGSFVFVPEDDFPGPPYNGWVMTRKAKETDAFRKASEKEAEICAGVFGGTKQEWMAAHCQHC